MSITHQNMRRLHEWYSALNSTVVALPGECYKVKAGIVYLQGKSCVADTWALQELVRWGTIQINVPSPLPFNATYLSVMSRSIIGVPSPLPFNATYLSVMLSASDSFSTMALYKSIYLSIYLIKIQGQGQWQELKVQGQGLFFEDNNTSIYHHKS